MFKKDKPKGSSDNCFRPLALVSDSESRRGFEDRLIAYRESITKNLDKIKSPFGQDLNHIPASLQSTERATSPPSQLRLASMRFKSSREQNQLSEESFHFLKTPEYTKAPVLGTWKAYYMVSVGFFISELLLFTFLSATY